MTKEEAKEIAIQRITKGKIFPLDDYPVILDDETIEFYGGWVFFYNGSKCLETKDPFHSYIGNAPILVDKYKRTAEFIGSIECTIDESIRDYCIEQNYPV